MDDFLSFTQDKVAVVALILLLLGMTVRLGIFAGTLRDGAIQQNEPRFRYAVKTLARMLVPLHGIIRLRPVYTFLRYGFHLCLFLVLFTGGSHAALFKSLHLSFLSRELPEPLVDRATVLLICCLLFFFLKKLVLPGLRNQASGENIFIGAVTFPVVTGYVAHHGWLNFELMLALHLASGVALVFSFLFLFCRSTVATEQCTGCKACSVCCPTGALKAIDSGGQRVFEYSHYQCVCCATCVRSCPEGAVSLKHRIGVRYAIEYHRVPDRSLPLHQCEECGQTITADSQLEQIQRLASEQGIELSTLNLCERCKRRSSVAWKRPAAMRREPRDDIFPAAAK